MTLAVTFSRANLGINAPLVSVETHLSNGLPAFTIVGLPEAAVRESRDRVRSALINSHFEFPDRRITVNLAPADLPKEGSRFDLAIALGILAASGQIPKEVLRAYEFVGELALSGKLRFVQGVIPALIHSGQSGRTIIIPSSNHAEACLPLRNKTLVADHILDVCSHLNGQKTLAFSESTSPEQTSSNTLDMSDVIGQPQAKRALEIAAAGGHNLLFIGPPGTGKTMLASRLSSIMPPLSEQASIDVAAIHSLAGKNMDIKMWSQRPFRTPHHTASAAAMVGGGSNPKPGEISLAHRGILFLDELPEYDRKVLEVLREPLESGCITISRAAQQIEFPAQFQLIAAMNPCPCGYFGDDQHSCRCSADKIKRYRAKLSGPLLDRIDIHVAISRQSTQLLSRNLAEEKSANIKTRVLSAQSRQLAEHHRLNAHISAKQLIDKGCIGEQDLNWLSHAIEKLGLSARAFHRLIKIAKTIADLDAAKMMCS